MIKDNLLKFAILSGVLLIAALLTTRGAAMPAKQFQQDPSNSLKSLDPETLEAFVDAFISENMEIAHVPGLVIEVVNENQTLLSKGYGYADIEKKIPMTSQTPVRAGSVSKPVTAIAVIQLVEGGLVDLNAPVSEYITTIPLEDKYGQASTVAQLLNHMGGYDDAVLLTHAPTVEEWQPSSR